MEVSWRAARVWRRDFDVFWTTWWTNAIPPIFEPVLYLLAFGAGVGALIDKPIPYQGRQVSYVAFIAPGLLAVTIMFWSFFETLYSSFVRMYYQKTFEAIVVTPLSLDDVIAGEIFWGASKAVGAATLMLGVISLFGILEPTALLVIPFAVLGGLFFASLGMIFTSICPTIDSFNLPVFLLIYPMFLFGGTFFPVTRLPHGFREIAYATPLWHAVDLVRHLTIGTPTLWFSLMHVAYLALWAAAGLLLARRTFTRRLVT